MNRYYFARRWPIIVAPIVGGITNALIGTKPAFLPFFAAVWLGWGIFYCLEKEIW